MTGSPDAGFRGKIALDIRDSEPDWTPYVAPTAPEGAPNILYPNAGSTRPPSTTASTANRPEHPGNHDAVAPLPVRGAHLVYLLPQQCCGRSRCDG